MTAATPPRAATWLLMRLASGRQQTALGAISTSSTSAADHRGGTGGRCLPRFQSARFMMCVPICCLSDARLSCGTCAPGLPGG